MSRLNSNQNRRQRTIQNYIFIFNFFQKPETHENGKSTFLSINNRLNEERAQNTVSEVSKMYKRLFGTNHIDSMAKRENLLFLFVLFRFFGKQC